MRLDESRFGFRKVEGKDCPSIGFFLVGLPSVDLLVDNRPETIQTHFLFFFAFFLTELLVMSSCHRVKL